ncbi:hypothetical protein STENM223S_08475 [Streptomyces tendae]
MAPISMSGSAIHMEVPSGKMYRCTVMAPKAPTMKISPWAKLMSWTMP